MRPVDAAYNILKSAGQPIMVHDLLEQVLETLKQDPEPQRMAQIYTEINVDVRFVHRGEGRWGLKEWAPKSGGGRASAGTRERNRAEDDVEELEEEDSWE